MEIKSEIPWKMTFWRLLNQFNLPVFRDFGVIAGRNSKMKSERFFFLFFNQLWTSGLLSNHKVQGTARCKHCYSGPLFSSASCSPQLNCRLQTYSLTGDPHIVTISRSLFSRTAMNSLDIPSSDLSDFSANHGVRPHWQYHLVMTNSSPWKDPLCY